MQLWQKTGEKLAYDGYRKVLRRTFTMPDGQSTDFDVVKSNGGAAILALTPDNQVVCFRQFRPGPEKVLYELPGGSVENEETAVQAIGRELQEETGYEADVEYLGSYIRDAYNTGEWHMFIGRNARQTKTQSLDHGEHGEIALLPIEEFKQILFAGQLTDTTLGYAGLHRLGLLNDG